MVCTRTENPFVFFRNDKGKKLTVPFQCCVYFCFFFFTQWHFERWSLRISFSRTLLPTIKYAEFEKKTHRHFMCIILFDSIHFLRNINQREKEREWESQHTSTIPCRLKFSNGINWCGKMWVKAYYVTQKVNINSTTQQSYCGEALLAFAYRIQCYFS